MTKKPKTPNEIIDAIDDLHSQEQDLLEQLKQVINPEDDDFDDNEFDDKEFNDKDLDG